jgi:hypothetical protein
MRRRAGKPGCRPGWRTGMAYVDRWATGGDLSEARSLAARAKEAASLAGACMADPNPVDAALCVNAQSLVIDEALKERQ